MRFMVNRGSSAKAWNHPAKPGGVASLDTSPGIRPLGFVVLACLLIAGLPQSTRGDEVIVSRPASARSRTAETRAPDAANPKADIEDVLFKDLPAQVVLSATKMEQPIYQAPSAITVITAEDIRHMGARRLVDVFRWTPGLDVFAVTGNISGVSARGVYSPHNRYVNEMLVLIDGRSVYVDFMGGVDWDALPVLLEEIERIEIIRGPSGSLYGPNAFAGTISIFTKRNPEASILHTTLGNNHYFESNFVHWLEGENYVLRLGIGWLENEGFGRAGGGDFRDDLNFLRMNMFGHFALDCDTDLEIRGGWLTGGRGFEKFGFDAFGREHTDVPYGQVNVEHRFSDDAKFRAQYFHNHFNFDRPFDNGTRGLETWTDVVTLEQYWRVHPCHQLIFGGEFRNFVAHSGLTDPNRVDENYRSLFVEDSITLIEKKLHFNGGVRYDDFTVSGDEFSPRSALVWTPTPQHSFRAALSRSAATPMSIATYLDFNTQSGSVDVGPPFGVVPILTRTRGNLGLDAESIVAYELGYRGRWSKQFDVGLDLFLYDVTGLIRGPPGTPAFDPTIPALVVPMTLENSVDSQAYGGELSLTYRWNECLSSFAGYSHKEIPDVTTTGPFSGLENSKNSVVGGFDWRLTCNWMLSSRVAWTDDFAVGNLEIGDYTRLDLRLARTIRDGCGTIELIGQNLLDPRHPESDTGAEVSRTFYVALELRF